MKKGIHPEYHRIMVKCTSCGAEFETGSTSKELRVDTCSNCHPFFTGRQRFAAAQGRIEKFNKKYQLKEKKQRIPLFFYVDGKATCVAEALCCSAAGLCYNG